MRVFHEFPRFFFLLTDLSLLVCERQEHVKQPSKCSRPRSPSNMLASVAGSDVSGYTEGTSPPALHPALTPPPCSCLRPPAGLIGAVPSPTGLARFRSQRAWTCLCGVMHRVVWSCVASPLWVGRFSNLDTPRTSIHICHQCENGWRWEFLADSCPTTYGSVMV